jgi:hypothetical protein
MKHLLLYLLTFGWATAITITDIPSNAECCNYIKLYKLHSSDPMMIQDVLQFVLNSGYSSTSSEIGKYLLNNNYRDYAQYCIEHMCSKAINDLLKLYTVKPDAIKKAYWDYDYITKNQLSKITFEPNKSIYSCAKFLKIKQSKLKDLISNNYQDKLQQVIYGVSPLENKMENIVLLA